MAYGVTTEWEDIHRKLGNLPEKPKEKTQDEIMSTIIDAVEQSDPLKYLSHEQLIEMQDDLEEQEFEKYRAQRIKELKEAARKPRFGNVIEISKQDFISEVNQAPTDSYVIIHMFQDYIVHCKLIDQCLDMLAQKFINHKFVRIQATRCVEGFRDSDCPTILVYKNSEVVHQFIACANLLGGNRISCESIEWVFAQNKIWQTDLEENPLNRTQSFVKKPRKNEDESDSDDDREYSSNQIRKYKF
jgi:thiol-disulfide isomerase/thioredoxin